MLVPKILIFGLARSGTNSLMRAFNEHPGMLLIDEPFRPKRKRPRISGDLIQYRDQVIDIPSLEQTVARIEQTYTGMKSLLQHLPKKLNKHLLINMGYKVIFLHRDNLLQAIVSSFLGLQTGIWEVNTNQDLEKRLPPLQSLDIELLRAKITKFRSAIRDYSAILKDSGTPYFDITYERLFLVSPEEKEKRLKEIFEFCEIELSSEILTKSMVFLGPERKLARYDLIPNGTEIERELGGGADGHLYES